MIKLKQCEVGILCFCNDTLTWFKFYNWNEMLIRKWMDTNLRIFQNWVKFSIFLSRFRVPTLFYEGIHIFLQFEPFHCEMIFWGKCLTCIICNLKITSNLLIPTLLLQTTKFEWSKVDSKKIRNNLKTTYLYKEKNV